MSASAAREAAFETLRAVRAGGLADRAFARQIGALTDRDRAWARELVFGTLRLRGCLDHAIRYFASRPIERIDADALDALRLGLYQLRFMHGVPDYAAVSETVGLTRGRVGKRAAGFVNGVLRAAARAPAEPPFPSLEDDPVAHLETWGSHPHWLVVRWIARYGAADAARLAAVDNTTPGVFLRPLGHDAATAADRLLEAGIAAEPVARVADALRLDDPADVVRALSVVPAIVQDPAAGLVADAIGPVGGLRVYDACAAPGGKSLALAAGTGGDRARYVVAADLSVGRVARLDENVRRVRAQLGGLPAGVLVADARRPPVTAVDAAVLDLPCTGTGTLRRHPDGRWRVGPADLRALVALQAEILAAMADVVVPGGLLLYATCSLEPEENEEQVDGFLERFPDWRIEPVEHVDGAFVDRRGFLRVLPQEHGFDGAFAARLRRSADAR